MQNVMPRFMVRSVRLTIRLWHAGQMMSRCEQSARPGLACRPMVGPFSALCHKLPPNGVMPSDIRRR